MRRFICSKTLNDWNLILVTKFKEICITNNCLAAFLQTEQHFQILAQLCHYLSSFYCSTPFFWKQNFKFNHIQMSYFFQRKSAIVFFLFFLSNMFNILPDKMPPQLCSILWVIASSIFMTSCQFYKNKKGTFFLLKSWIIFVKFVFFL